MPRENRAPEGSARGGVISLVPLSTTERAEFLELQVEEFAREKILAGHWTEREARKNSRKSISRLTGADPLARGHRFLKGVDVDGVRMGWIWIGPPPSPLDVERSQWLYQITVEESLRGRGFGRAMLTALERLLAHEGVDALYLNVFAWNHAARSLYDSMGYETVLESPTDAQMRKRLAR